MRKIVLGAIALWGLVGAAPTAGFAADLAPYSAPAEPYYSPTPLFNWSGLYLGANGGYGFGGFPGGGATPFGNSGSGMVGLTGGYNFQFFHFVFGVEGDADWASLKSAKSYLPGLVNETSKADMLWTLRARAGYAVDNILLFATGGYAGGTLETSLTDATVPVPAGGPTYRSNKLDNGYVIGAGMEYALSSAFSIKAEYLYRSLGNLPVFSGAHLTTAGLHESTVRGGVNFHF